MKAPGTSDTGLKMLFRTPSCSLVVWDSSYGVKTLPTKKPTRLIKKSRGDAYAAKARA